MAYQLFVPKFSPQFQGTLDFLFHEGHAKSRLRSVSAGQYVHSGDKVLWTELSRQGFLRSITGLDKGLKLVFRAPCACIVSELREDYHSWVDNSYSEHIKPFAFKVENETAITAISFYGSFFSELLDNKDWVNKEMAGKNFPHSRWVEDCESEQERMSSMQCECIKE